MSNSLRDQLLNLGFKPAPAAKPAKTRGKPPVRQGKPEPFKPPALASKPRHSPQPPKPSPESAEEMNLAKAYALRQQQEKEERIRAEQAKQEEARKRREARQQLARLIEGKTLNVAEAEIPRHFQYGGKIRRVYVTPEQLKAVNAGEIGIIQIAGRYHLVPAGLAREGAKIFPDALALLVDSNAPKGGDEYADPQYQVPDDLVWWQPQ